MHSELPRFLKRVGRSGGTEADAIKDADYALGRYGVERAQLHELRKFAI